MKKKTMFRTCTLGILLILISRIPALAQEPPELLLEMKYYAAGNGAPYVYVYAKIKLEKKKFTGVPSIPVSVYLDSLNDRNLLGKILTDKNGEGRVYIDFSLKQAWDDADTHTFLGATEAVKPYSESTGELKITKARILLDTLLEDTIRYLNIKVEELKGNTWVPVKDVELKAAIKRLGGDLNIADEATYTTDSSGSVKAEFKRDGLPGDSKGMLTLVARVEDNETFGNLEVEKMVQWGKPFLYHSIFNESTLYATRDKTPWWLLGLAAIVIVIVWGTLIYLILQVLKIRKIGRKVV